MQKDTIFPATHSLQHEYSPRAFDCEGKTSAACNESKDENGRKRGRGVCKAVNSEEIRQLL